VRGLLPPKLVMFGYAFPRARAMGIFAVRMTFKGVPHVGGTAFAF
jgi:hypothetical protein